MSCHRSCVLLHLTSKHSVHRMSVISSLVSDPPYSHSLFFCVLFFPFSTTLFYISNLNSIHLLVLCNPHIRPCHKMSNFSIQQTGETYHFLSHFELHVDK
eukprot:UN04368